MADAPSTPVAGAGPDRRVLLRQQTQDLSLSAATARCAPARGGPTSPSRPAPPDVHSTRPQLQAAPEGRQLRERQATAKWGSTAPPREVRDEFACPITRSFMSEPVVAADGYTYEREAIECWFQSHATSPMTGLPMPKTLVPNRNLRELTSSLLEEGGEGLYRPVAAEEERAAAHRPLVREKVATLTCVGPMNSELVGRTFRVDRGGALGGRKRPEEDGGRRVILLPDATVSRLHFVIDHQPADNAFAVVDMGSAGGTYVRLPYPKHAVLAPGVSFLVGNHQLTVFAASPASSSAAVAEEEEAVTPRQGERELAAEERAARAAAEVSVDGLLAASDEALAATAVGLPETDEMAAESPPRVASPSGGGGGGNSELDGVARILLKCTSPMDSPFVDREFLVTERGATLGRRHTNDVAFCREMNGTMYGLDGAISGVHARVEFHAASGEFRLFDGTAERRSTNGTWLRLSDQATRSAPKPLTTGMELLFGATLRFQVKIEEVILERSPSVSASASASASADGAASAALPAVVDSLEDGDAASSVGVAADLGVLTTDESLGGAGVASGVSVSGEAGEADV